MSNSHPLLRLLGTDPKRVVGLMSGTSLDGIDAALVEIRGHGPGASAHLLRFHTGPFPPGLREAIEAVLDPGHATSAADLSTLNFRLGHAFGEAAVAIAQGEPIDLVASHGQTVWHQPPWMKHRSDLIASTLQLGEPAVIAAHTGAVTVGDFRVADVAVGGEGAPLVPYADWVLFRRPGQVRALQNIGGIANVTVVGDRLAEVFAFDNGPGNIIIDELAMLASEGADRCDRDGRLSAAGRVLPHVLADLLDDDFLRRPPPKSTGRERYGKAFVHHLRERHPGERAVDLLTTAVRFTAEAIATSYRAFVLPRTPLAEVVVAGGGAHNLTLMAELGALLQPLTVRRFDDAGIPADAKEAVAFALLGVETIHASCANVVAATGARKPTVLGKICLPPP
ncbi:MAG TPA: anhydro-N-acetylmuramic acid kinase [Polyangia bacterium]|jgi:anhydro-N-acetylmuramic acid kinase|nr:anhydro-N-acetylmuramic acid kinase [Polyangia bacterium]